MTDAWRGGDQTGQSAAALELHDVVVDAARRRILDGVRLRIAAGETVVVAGAAGFGGTTLARVVAGALRPRRGKVLVNGHDVTDAEPGRRPEVGYVPAGGGLLPHLTAADNVCFGMRLRGEPGYLRRQRFADAVEALELRPSLDLRPHEMSAGQRLRVAIARLAVRRPHPDVWVVDATGDGYARGIAALIGRFHRGDPAILLCTDDRHHSAVVGDAHRLLVVHQGKVVTDAPLAAFRADPPDLLTARLALPAPLPVCTGVVTAGGVDCDRLRLPRPPWVPTGERVQVALPPEALSLSDQGEVPGRVTDVRPEGARSRVLVEPHRRPGERWPVYCDSGDRPQLRDRVGLRVDPARMLVFESGTGRRRRAGEAS